MHLQLLLQIPTDNPPSPQTHIYSFEVFILAILATRMHLHLWHMDQRTEDSDIIAWLSMSDMPPADRTV